MKFILFLFLTMQYNNRGLPERWTQANINPVNVTYGRLGLVGTWQQGALSEVLNYDDYGNVVKMQNSEGTPWIFSYEDKVSDEVQIFYLNEYFARTHVVNMYSLPSI